LPPGAACIESANKDATPHLRLICLLRLVQCKITAATSPDRHQSEQCRNNGLFRTAPPPPPAPDLAAHPCHPAHHRHYHSRRRRLRYSERLRDYLLDLRRAVPATRGHLCQHVAISAALATRDAFTMPRWTNIATPSHGLTVPSLSAHHRRCRSQRRRTDFVGYLSRLFAFHRD